MDDKQGTFGLIGETAGHSLLPMIHAQLGEYDYQLMPVAPAQLRKFTQSRAFCGVNVAMPYQKTVLPYLDEISLMARNIGAVNTIVRRDDRIFGYNTEYDGFLYLLRKNAVQVVGKSVLVLGNGTTCQTVCAVLRNVGAKRIVIADSAGEKAPGVVAYPTITQTMRKQINLIINTTPVGMFPNNDDQPIELERFANLTAVVDVICNPLRTNLILQAERLGLQAVGGLEMLVAQAAHSWSLFFGRPCNDAAIAQLHAQIKQAQSNLVLIGMPGCGKSRVGKRLSKQMNRGFADLDKILQKDRGMSIERIFELVQEEGFREMESETVAQYAKQNGLVIATGGGVILRKQNTQRLKQNGVLAFMDRPLCCLPVGKGRPLSVDRSAIKRLRDKRYGLYKQASDYTVFNFNNFEKATREIKEKFYEAIGPTRPESESAGHS